jgi:endonuclease III
MCIFPETVGGGVSMENIGFFDLLLKENIFFSSQYFFHLFSKVFMFCLCMNDERGKVLKILVFSEIVVNKKAYFLQIYKKAENKYGMHNKKLAGEGWGVPWRTLIVTILSAQSRDETTIPIAEMLFKKYSTLKKLSCASHKDVLRIIKRINYNRTKAKNVIAAAIFIRNEFNGKVPDEIDELLKIPGVGRKTANLVRWECFGKHCITVDTHVHRISNVLGIVNTKTPHETEIELEKIVPKKYWGKVNRMFVLWGKEASGRDKKKLLRKLDEIS